MSSFLADRLGTALPRGAGDGGDGPDSLPGRYESAEDLEVVGWIASAFAYGRVETIQANVGRILEILGPRPAETLDRISDFRELARGGLAGFRHRFHGAEDAAVLLFAISQARAQAGSVRAFFESDFRPEDRDVGPLLSRVVAKIAAFDYRPVTGRRMLPESSRRTSSS